MSWIDDYNNAALQQVAGGAVHVFNPQQNTPQPQAKKKGNFVTNLLPSVGGIIGGAGGGALGGAAAGTALLPGIGTAAGGLIGALLGGAAGGAAGKVAENKIEGNSLGEGVAKEALINGAFSAGPIRLAKFAGGVVKGGVNASRGAGTVLKETQAARGIPVNYIDNGATGTAGAILPKTANNAVTALDDVSFVNRFKPGATQAAKSIPGITSTFASTGSKDPLNLVVSHLATKATKGDTRTIVNQLFPAGLDNTARNGLIRDLQKASTPDEVKGILSSVDQTIRSTSTGAIAPTGYKVGFQEGPQSSALLPAKPQPTQMVESAAAKPSLTDAINTSAENAMNSSMLKTVGNKLSSSGQNLIAKEFRLNPTQQSNFAKLHGEEATSVLRRHGVKSPEDIQAKLQPIQDAFDGVITKIPAVSQQELSVGLQKVYGPLLKSPALFERGLGEQIKTQADELVRLAQSGSIPASKVNELRKTFDAAVSYTQRGAPEYNVIKKTADALRGTLQTAADKAGVRTADGLTFKEAGKELRKLYGLDEIIGKQQYLGTGNLPISIGNLPGVGVGGAAGGVPGAIAGYAVNSAVNSPMGRRAVTNATLRTGEKLVARGEKNANNPLGVKGVATRVAPVGLAGALVDQSLLSNNTQQTDATSANNINQPNTANMIDLSSSNNGDLSSASLPEQTSPYDVQNIEANVQKIIAAGGKAKDVQDYLSIASVVNEMKAKANPQGKALNSTQLQQANNAQSGIDSLQTIANIIGQNPNAPKLASLPGGSLTQSLTGTGKYQTAIANATDVIGRLRSGGAINADEEKRFRSLLPASFDDSETINYKLNALGGLFQRFANPEAAQPDAASLISALGA